MKKSIFFLFLLFATTTFAQKELTLSESVMEQYRKFYPERPILVKWIPNTSEYTHLKGYTSLVKVNVPKNQEETLLTIGELNQIAATKFNWFSGFEWLNSNEFTINDGTTFLVFNPFSKTLIFKETISDQGANALFSYEAKKIAYTIDNNVYVGSTAITTNTDKNIISGSAIARSEFGISGGLFWSSKGNKLAFYQKDESEVADYPLLDITTTPGTLKNIKYPMAGQKSEKPKVGIYDLNTGKTIFISPRYNADDYLTNFAFTPDEKYVIIAEVNRDQNLMNLNAYDASTGEYVKTFFTHSNSKWVEPEHPAYFMNDGTNNFVWISEHSGFNNIYFFEFDKSSIKTVTSNKFVTKNILAINKGKIYFSATGQSPLNTMIYVVDLKGNQTLLTKSEGTHEFELSSDAKYFYDGYSSISIPFEANIYHINGKLAKHILTAENKLADYKLGVTEIGTLTAKDGSTLYTRMIKPSDFDPSKKYPVLIYVYGGPHAQMITNSWYAGANLWMNWMAEQGYIIFTLDNRGSAERGFEFESQIHRQLGKVEMEDQLTGVEYLKSLPFVDANRLAVHGWSFGGFMTTSLLTQHPGVFTTGVAGGPVTDWKYYEIMYGERYMDRPEQNPEGYKSTSVIENAKNLKDNLLLIHGTEDDVVVMQHNYALIKQFVDLGIQVDFFPYPTHAHNVRGKDRVHLIEKILKYILEHNK